MMKHYDENNVFAKIIAGHIPVSIIFENDVAMAFYDISPKAKIHILLIPKGYYVNVQDFYSRADASEINGFHDALLNIIAQHNLSPADNTGGFRIISNAGHDSGQEVPHYHLHILGGERLGDLI
jgi:histidine triad (HIT) family protein